MATPPRDWPREEYDRLDTLMGEGLTYTQIAEVMGRTYDSVASTAKRLGLQSKERQRKRAKHNWDELDPIIRNLVEVERMTGPQICERLAALGNTVAKTSVLERIAAMPRSVRWQLRENAKRRRAVRVSVYHQRQRAKRQQEKAA